MGKVHTPRDVPFSQLAKAIEHANTTGTQAKGPEATVLGVIRPLTLSIDRGVTARLRHIDASMRQIGAGQTRLGDEGVLNSIRIGVASDLVEAHGAQQTALGKSVRALTGRDPAFSAALEDLGLPLSPEQLTRNMLSSLTAMARQAQPGIPGLTVPAAPAGHAMAKRMAFQGAVEASFGTPPKDTGVHLLVTMDATNASPQTLQKLYKSGMTAVRINNAHDPEATRTAIAQIAGRTGLEHVLRHRRTPVQVGELIAALERHAQQQAMVLPQKPRSFDGRLAWAAEQLSNHPGLRAKVSEQGLLHDRPMILSDLAGPKNRTGPTEATPGVIKVKVARTPQGRSLEPGDSARVRLNIGSPPATAGEGAPPTVIPTSITAEAAANLAKQVQAKGPQMITVRDAEGTRNRNFLVEGVLRDEGGRVVALDGVAQDSTYFHEAAELGFGKGKHWRPLGAVGKLPATPQPLLLRDGELLVIKADASYVGHSARADAPATIGTQLPEALNFVQKGHRVVLDDGAINSVIQEVRRGKKGQVDEVVVRIGGGSGETLGMTRKLAAEKGMNFPDSDIAISSLTKKDLEDLPFVLRNADVVAYSFVQTAADVAALVRAMRQTAIQEGLATPKTVDAFLATKGICAKIETKKAVANLEEIMLAIEASGMKPSAMIARGDLAVELGFENLGRAQSHLEQRLRSGGWPFIYATQIMESLAKRDVPSRPEWTDVDIGIRELRAPVVMLNKGPYMPTVLEQLTQFARQNAVAPATVSAP